MNQTRENFHPSVKSTGFLYLWASNWFCRRNRKGFPLLIQFYGLVHTSPITPVWNAVPIQNPSIENLCEKSLTNFAEIRKLKKEAVWWINCLFPKFNFQIDAAWGKFYFELKFIWKQFTWFELVWEGKVKTVIQKSNPNLFSFSKWKIGDFDSNYKFCFSVNFYDNDISIWCRFFANKILLSLSFTRRQTGRQTDISRGNGRRFADPRYAFSRTVSTCCESLTSLVTVCLS